MATVTINIIVTVAFFMVYKYSVIHVSIIPFQEAEHNSNMITCAVKIRKNITNG